MIEISLFPERLVAGEEHDLGIRVSNTGQGTCTSVVFKLVLPQDVLVLRGGDRVELERIAAGETYVKTIRVRASRPGQCRVGSNNFSYRDPYGRGQRITGFSAELVVEPPVEVVRQEPPRFETRLLTAELPFNEWSELRIRVTNTGRVSMPDVGVRVRGQLDVDNDGVWQELGRVQAGGHVDVGFHVRASQRGSHVPVHVDTRCGPARVSQEMGVRVAAAGSPPAKVGILYLSANPVGTERLRVDRDVREIREALVRGQARDEFEFHDRFAVRTRDLSQSLHDCHPTVIHFSCHGSADGSIVLESDGGRAMPTSLDAIAQLFSIVSDEVECVIVSACGSAPLAKMIARHVKYAIGMEDTITDRTAISFSIGFYQALAARQPVEKAFQFGLTQVNLDNGDGDQPVLFVR